MDAGPDEPTIDEAINATFTEVIDLILARLDAIDQQMRSMNRDINHLLFMGDHPNHPGAAIYHDPNPVRREPEPNGVARFNDGGLHDALVQLEQNLALDRDPRAVNQDPHRVHRPINAPPPAPVWHGNVVIREPQFNDLANIIRNGAGLAYANDVYADLGLNDLIVNNVREPGGQE